MWISSTTTVRFNKKKGKMWDSYVAALNYMTRFDDDLEGCEIVEIVLDGPVKATADELSRVKKRLWALYPTWCRGLMNHRADLQAKGVLEEFPWTLAFSPKQAWDPVPEADALQAALRHMGIKKTEFRRDYNLFSFRDSTVALAARMRVEQNAILVNILDPDIQP